MGMHFVVEDGASDQMAAHATRARYTALGAGRLQGRPALPRPSICPFPYACRIRPPLAGLGQEADGRSGSERTRPMMHTAGWWDEAGPVVRR